MKKLLIIGALAAIALVAAAPGGQAKEFSSTQAKLGQDQNLENRRGGYRGPRRGGRHWGGGPRWGFSFGHGPRYYAPYYAPYYYAQPQYYSYPGYYYNPGVVVVPSAPQTYYCR